MGEIQTTNLRNRPIQDGNTSNTAGKSSDDSDGTPGKTDDTGLTKTDGRDPSGNDSPEKSQVTQGILVCYKSRLLGY
jgi:hypothetical protein